MLLEIFNDIQSTDIYRQDSKLKHNLRNDLPANEKDRSFYFRYILTCADFTERILKCVF